MVLLVRHLENQSSHCLRPEVALTAVCLTPSDLLAVVNVAMRQSRLRARARRCVCVSHTHTHTHRESKCVCVRERECECVCVRVALRLSAFCFYAGVNLVRFVFVPAHGVLGPKHASNPEYKSVHHIVFAAPPPRIRVLIFHSTMSIDTYLHFSTKNNTLCFAENNLTIPPFCCADVTGTRAYPMQWRAKRSWSARQAATTPYCQTALTRARARHAPLRPLQRLRTKHTASLGPRANRGSGYTR